MESGNPVNYLSLELLQIIFGMPELIGADLIIRRVCREWRWIIMLLPHSQTIDRAIYLNSVPYLWEAVISPDVQYSICITSQVRADIAIGAAITELRYNDGRNIIVPVKGRSLPTKDQLVCFPEHITTPRMLSDVISAKTAKPHRRAAIDIMQIAAAYCGDSSYLSAITSKSSAWIEIWSAAAISDHRHIIEHYYEKIIARMRPVDYFDELWTIASGANSQNVCDFLAMNYCLHRKYHEKCSQRRYERLAKYIEWLMRRFPQNESHIAKIYCAGDIYTRSKIRSCIEKM